VRPNIANRAHRRLSRADERGFDRSPDPVGFEIAGIFGYFLIRVAVIIHVDNADFVPSRN
jgi:hypothetical protein